MLVLLSKKILEAKASEMLILLFVHETWRLGAEVVVIFYVCWGIGGA